MQDSDTMIAIRYIFILSFILLIIAYWAGSTKVLSTAGGVVGNLGNIFTGRDTQGKFASYPGGAPA